MVHQEHKTSDGTKYPSVTEVTGIFDPELDGFYKWACDQIGDHLCCRQAAWAYSEDCKRLGERIHYAREMWLKGIAVTLSDYEFELWEPIRQFYIDSGYKAESTESQLTSERILLGGSSDGVGRFREPFWKKLGKRFWVNYPGFDPSPDDLWLDDLKVKSKIDKLHPLQLFGYRLLEQEVNKRTVKWGLIIRREKDLNKTPQIQLKGYYLPAYEAFWNASRLMWDFLNA